MGYLRAIWRLMTDVWNTASERQVGLIAAGVAFFGMFAIFPGIGAVISIFGILADPTIVIEQLTLLEDIIPPDSFSILKSQTERLLGARNDALSWASALSILLALWAARAGVAALMGGLNAIAGQAPRGGLKHYAVALALTACLVILGTVALAVVIIAPLILAFFPLQGSGAVLLVYLRWALVMVVLYAALALIYRYGPNQSGARLKWFTIGSAIVILLWIAASSGLSFYLTNFASYNEVYGSIGAVIGMLLWLYVSAYLILLGASLNLHLYGGVSGRQS